MANATTTILVETLDDLNAAIAQIDAIGRGGSLPVADYVIKLTANIKLGTSQSPSGLLQDAEGSVITVDGATAVASNDLYALNPETGVSLTIDGRASDGSSYAINGVGTYQGFVAAGGVSTLQAVRVVNMLASGEAGTNGSGGGAGLGGGLFVAKGSRVTLSGVSFSRDAATGGAGAAFTGNASGGTGDGGFGDGGSVNSSGGFGGGGGGQAGAGGFGAGAGGAAGGGGGLGAGGDVFVQQGGILTIADGSLGVGTDTAGAGSDAADSGQAFGDSLFIQGSQTVTMAPSTDQTLTISGVIADEIGSNSNDPRSGAGRLLLNGAGTVVLAAANTYTGGTTLRAGTLDVVAPASAGTGPITFGPNARATLQINAAALADGDFSNTIVGFATSDTLDILGIASATTSFDYSTDVLTLTDASGTTTTFQLSGSYAGQVFTATTDNAGGTNVILAPSSSIPVAPSGGTVVTLADAVSIDPHVTYGDGAFIFTVRASIAAGVADVEISALVDGVQTDLGAATLDGDGSFTFTDPIGATGQSFIAATATDGAGGTVATSAAFSLQGGLSGGRFVAEQDAYNGDGSVQTATNLFRADDSRRVYVEASGQTLASDTFDTFLNHEAPNNTFVFDPGHGLGVVSGFRVDGTDHDRVSLLGSDFGNSIADVLRNTHNVGGSAVITDPTSGDSVRLAGVTKAELKANRSDLAFHG